MRNNTFKGPFFVISAIFKWSFPYLKWKKYISNAGKHISRLFKSQQQRGNRGNRRNNAEIAEITRKLCGKSISEKVRKPHFKLRKALFKRVLESKNVLEFDVEKMVVFFFKDYYFKCKPIPVQRQPVERGVQPSL